MDASRTCMQYLHTRIPRLQYGSVAWRVDPHSPQLVRQRSRVIFLYVSSTISSQGPRRRSTIDSPGRASSVVDFKPGGGMSARYSILSFSRRVLSSSWLVLARYSRLLVSISALQHPVVQQGCAVIVASRT
jgi:hypothetical protein